MQAAFKKSGQPIIQGRIRCYSQVNNLVSIKPYQVRNLVEDTSRVPWAKKNEKAISIILPSAEDSNYHWKTRHPINTSLDILEKIVDLAELGFSFDLTPYSGKNAKRLDDIKDVLPDAFKAKMTKSSEKTKFKIG